MQVDASVTEAMNMSRDAAKMILSRSLSATQGSAVAQNIANVIRGAMVRLDGAKYLGVTPEAEVLGLESPKDPESEETASEE